MGYTLFNRAGSSVVPGWCDWLEFLPPYLLPGGIKIPGQLSVWAGNYNIARLLLIVPNISYPAIIILPVGIKTACWAFVFLLFTHLDAQTINKTPHNAKYIDW